MNPSLHLPGDLLHYGHADGHPVQIRDRGELRSLYFGNGHLQSQMSLKEPYRLQLSYTRFMVFPVLLTQELTRVCILGLGAGSMVRFFHHFHPQCRLDAVDPNQTVIELARGYFQLPDAPTVQIHCQPGERFITAHQATYDQIYVDAFDDLGMAPGIYNQTSLAGIATALREGGVASFNLWSANRSYFKALKEAINEVFAHVLLLPVPERGNVVAIASDRPFWAKLSKRRRELAQLSKRYQVDFSEMLKVAKRQHRPFPWSLFP